MGFLTPLFQKDIDKAAEEKAMILVGNQLPTLLENRINELMPGLQQQIVGNLYNYNVFQWINNGQLILDFEDKYKFIKEGFQRNADVYTCIDLISKKVAECDYTLFEIKSGVTKKEIKRYENLCLQDSLGARIKAVELKKQIFEEVEQNPILTLLERPNQMQNYEEWMMDLAGFFLCTGDGYMMGNSDSEKNLYAKLWTELFCMPSHYMKIISGGWLQPVKGYSLVTVYTDEIPIPADQIHHFKTFNPDFTMTGASLYGQSPIKAIWRNVVKENMGNEELIKQIRNGGVMGFISPDSDGQTLTSPQLDLLKNELREAKEGETIMDRIFPSTGPLKWTQIGLPSTDLQLIESLNIDTKKIFAAYHVPMIYSSSEEASNMSNVSSAPKQLIYNAVTPVQRKIRDAINQFVCKPYERAFGKRYYFDFDISSYPEMQEDMGRLTEWLDKSPEITLNEKRVAKGYDRLNDPNMDKIYVSANIVPLYELGLDAAYNQPFNPVNNGKGTGQIP